MKLLRFRKWYVAVDNVTYADEKAYKEPSSQS